MTIYKAIEKEKEKAEHAKEEYLMLQDDNFTDIETYKIRLNNCAEFAKYHEQIEMWLEELKFYKEKDQKFIHLSYQEFADVYIKGRTDVINEIKQITHDIFIQNLHCKEMCRSEEMGYGCDDCLYAAIDSRLNKLKEENSDT